MQKTACASGSIEKPGRFSPSTPPRQTGRCDLGLVLIEEVSLFVVAHALIPRSFVAYPLTGQKFSPFKIPEKDFSGSCISEILSYFIVIFIYILCKINFVSLKFPLSNIRSLRQKVNRGYLVFIFLFFFETVNDDVVLRPRRSRVNH